MQVELIKLLEKHLTQSELATDVYKIKLHSVLEGLKSGFYTGREEGLIMDLQSLGFWDVARDVRKGMYI